MAWTTPDYSRSQVDKAGVQLLTLKEGEGGFEDALQITNNWRSSHSFPLNAFQILLRRVAITVDKNALIAQRVKRLSSIEHKLRRFKSMKLSQMQDLGGCRAVVHSTSSVTRLVDAFKGSKTKQQLDHVDDYILKPKPSGYRGVHLIYRYNSDKTTVYNGHKIEIQIRSPLQHAWATAIETVGTFTRQALKSSQGEEQWLRFFSLMGTALAEREGTPPVPDTPRDPKILIKELRVLDKQLRVARRLRTYGAALNTLDKGIRATDHYYLLALDAHALQVRVRGFPKRDLDRATEAYLATEREFADNPQADAVLVSVESLAQLRRAYPNYFLDTKAFTAAVTTALYQTRLDV